MNVSTIWVEVKADINNLLSGLRRAETASQDTSTSLAADAKSVSTAWSGIGDVIAGALNTAALLGFVSAMTDTASKTQGQVRKISTVFAQASDDVMKWADTNAAAMGLTSKEAAALAADVGATFKAIGFGADQVGVMSTQVTTLAAALSSWTEGEKSVADAQEIVAAALRGETDSIQELGYIVDQDIVKAKLQAEGKDKLTGAALKQAEAQATLAVILDQSKDKLDAYSASSEGVATQQKVIAANMEEVRTQVAEGLTPAIAFLTDKIAEATGWFKTLPAPIKVTVAAVVSATLAVLALIPVIGMMVGAVGTIKPAMLAASTAVRGAMTSIGASISSAIWPVTLVVAAIAGLYLAYKNNFLGIRDFLKPVIENIIAIYGKIVEGVKFVTYNSDTLWKGFVEGFKLTAQTIGQIVKGVGLMLSGVGLILYGAFVEPWVPVLVGLQAAARGIVTGLSSLVNRIAQMLQPVFGILKTLGISVGNALQVAMSAVSGVIGDVFGSAVSDIKSKADAASANSATIAKGMKQVEDGYNTAATAVKGYTGALRGVVAATQANLKTPPPVNVANATLPKPPANSYSASNPAALQNYGVDAANAAAKVSEDAAKKAADAATKRKQAIEDEITSLTRLLASNKRLVDSGKMTVDNAINFRQSVEDLAKAAQREGIANDAGVKSLLSKATAYTAVALAAGKAHEAALTAKEAAREQAQKDKEANAAVKQNAKALTDLLVRQKDLVNNNKITIDQAINYKRRLDEINANIKEAGVSGNATIKMLLGQASAYAAVSMSAAAAKDAKTKHEANQKKLDADYEKRLANLKSVTKAMSDEEIASKIKVLSASKDYKKEKLLEVLYTEQATRAKAAEQTQTAGLIDALGQLAEAQGKVTAAVDGFNQTIAAEDFSTRVTTLQNAMAAELAAVEGNEAATLEIKKKYAPQLLAIEIDRVNAETQAKLDKIEETYNKELSEATLAGAETTDLTKAYEATRVAISNSATATIAGIRNRSAAEITSQEIALDKKVVEERVRINSDAADTIVSAYLEGLSSLDTAGIALVKTQLEALRDSFLAMGESGLGAVDKINDAIKTVSDESARKVKEAVKGFSSIAGQLKGLDKEFADLQLDPDSKDAFVSQGLAGFDTLIAKYDDLISSAGEYADVLEGAGDVAGAALMRAEADRLRGVQGDVQAARTVKQGQLGTTFDTNKAKADKEAADTKAKAEKAAADSILATDNSIVTSQLANATTLAEFKLKKLEDEKAAKLSLATTDQERAEIELSYVDRITAAQLEALEVRKNAADEALKQELAGQLDKEGLTTKQKEDIEAYFAERKRLADDAYAHERDQIKQTATEAEKAQRKQLEAWKQALAQFVKDLSSAVSTAYASIYDNNSKLAAGSATPEDTAKANHEAAENAGVGIFNAAVTGLKAVFPQFAYFIDLIGGLLANMPQLGLVFQRVGEIFLVAMDILAPVVELLASVLEPLLNILKVVLESVIKPLLPVLTFFLKVTSAIITAIYNVIKTVWNAIAGFLNGIDILGWKPFNLSMLPELEGVNGANTPSVDTGTVGGTGSSSGGATSKTETRTANVTIYVNEASNPEEVASLVEKRLIKALG
ncbi:MULTISPECIES: hypothetical protein [Deinococcus]|uniref:Tape measure protein n=1 Tax=Deinococcus rufus TaxID=2136097 RepID=A0ABV7Z9Y3_9DEIO|nr:hypothetical protein [Deinococcus sp. AB2017081]WQE94433.1 hypothetical protein U2P90_13590 [Deinococcus sp. AB2017081]